MKQSIKSTLAVGIGLVAAAGLVLVPAAANAAQQTSSTTVRTTIASTISLSTGPLVTMGVTPVAGGSQSSVSDTATVSTNNPTGYTLTLQDADATTTLTDGSNTIAASANTPAAPAALANNTWGFAVPALGSFDASYSVLTNASSSASKWAGVPASGSPFTVYSHGTTASGVATTVWYSTKADTTKPAGDYNDGVVYTATTQ